MTKHAQVAAAPSVNFGMKMSPQARVRMRRLERDVFKYYDDMGTGKGNCTWGPGILAHRGPCSKEELARPVSAAAVEAELPAGSWKRKAALYAWCACRSCRKTSSMRWSV
jgi:hypothetical protein